MRPELLNAQKRAQIRKALHDFREHPGEFLQSVNKATIVNAWEHVSRRHVTKPAGKTFVKLLEGAKAQQKQEKRTLKQAKKQEKIAEEQRITQQYTEALNAQSAQKEKERREVPIYKATRKALEQDVKSYELDTIARIVKYDEWKVPLIGGTKREIDFVSRMKMKIAEDGTVERNESKIGYEISFNRKYRYPYRTYRGSVLRSVKTSNSLEMGVGYFTNKKDFLPDATGGLTEEMLKKGVKSFYITKTYPVKNPGGEFKLKTETIVIPLAYADSQKVFAQQLYASAEKLSPKEVKKQRIQAGIEARKYGMGRLNEIFSTWLSP